MEGAMEKHCHILAKLGVEAWIMSPSQILLCAEPINTSTLEPIGREINGSTVPKKISTFKNCISMFLI
jgi:hypothetical protein